MKFIVRCQISGLTEFISEFENHPQPAGIDFSGFTFSPHPFGTVWKVYGVFSFAVEGDLPGAVMTKADWKVCCALDGMKLLTDKRWQYTWTLSEQTPADGAYLYDRNEK